MRAPLRAAHRRVPVLMQRRSILIGLSLLSTACARQFYPAPAAARPSVVSAGVPSGAGTGIGALSSSETVNYILARGLIVPVAGVTVAQLQDTFDEGRDAGRMHRALDILSPRGTPVLAADDGRILRIGPNALGGNTVYATDPLGRVVYYYAHLDAYQPGLVAGATIARGDTLGIVGTTGNAPKDTPHLHFQVMRMPSDGKYWDGEPINPYPLFLLMHAARP
ncbi:MAG: Peptidase [Gemmatimonadetes bacterium]|nr:Peptidase [Gemmatimonadota bacterium]